LEYGYLIVMALLPAVVWYGAGVILPWALAARRGDRMPLISSWAIQLAAAPAILALIAGPDWGTVAFLAVPGLLPLAHLGFVLRAASEIVVQQSLAVAFGLLAGLVTGVTIARRGMVRYLLIAVIASAAAVTLATAEFHAGHRIITRAEQLGARCLTRQSFLASVRQQSSWRRHHAEALIGGEWQIWSYRANDFQATPSGVWRDPWQRDCEERAAWEREGGRP
jgi:hypothetical protein